MSEYSESERTNANETLVESESTAVENSLLNDIIEESEQQNYNSIDNINIENTENVIERIQISKLGYVMFVVFGLTMLCAWNLWITAVPFFRNRLSGTIFQDNFQNYISIMFMLTNTLSSFITLKIQEKISINRRIIGSLMLLIFCFLATSVLSLISDMNPYLFFIIIMILIVISAISTAVLQNGGFGLAAQLPNIYMQGIMNGQGLAGAVVVVIQIAIVANTQDTGNNTEPEFLKNMYLYFFAVVLITITCLVGYLKVIRKVALRIINNSVNQTEGERALNLNDNEETPLIRHENTPRNESLIISNDQKIKRTMKKTNVQISALFCTSVVTLSLFPSVISGIESINKGKNSNYYNNLFVSFAFLIFTLCDWLGKVMPGHPKLIIRNKRIINIVSFSRILFIFLFMVCNVQFKDNYGNSLDRSLPILVRSDILYFIILVVFSISNGYISSLLLMITPELVDDDEKELSGSIMVFVLTFGLASGSIFSFAIRAMLCKCNPFIS
ncbi:hypothetical protein BCR36DRAFT_586206 [Piromyces finnis]|uniref:Nucleoside transporter n=1 Tax=Piromyces finnis TaxID=1754191 RepID=A0A1Y1UZY5_9FUNG|nr:hypothetical protein BCR36DRAFT_586206 [Piromyces finnis]|eukprot:ORX44347.1 hypothetical protein BCR36DRAFT_586206 [Piromyces finnis]